ncbi:MAG: hypothetical protein KME46_32945 [Brasilonema angustatum HA4187-MV1]|jgi:glutamine synthetase type III|nr:hypothetical protein [Brasilonema angustatum HA4187-MV1]
MSNTAKNEGIIQHGGTINAEQLAVGRYAMISGTVTKTIGQLQESDASEALKLAELLKELQTAIEAEANLTQEDKAEALEQVKVLAEVGQESKEGVMQKTAKKAITMLRGTISVLPTTASLVEACSKLLPLITKLFGLG